MYIFQFYITLLASSSGVDGSYDACLDTVNCVQGLMRAFRVEDLPIESKMLTKALDEAQRKVENYFFDIRKQLFEFDEVLNSQRDRVYTERRRALESDNLQSLIVEYAELTMDDILEVIWISKRVSQSCFDLQKSQ